MFEDSELKKRVDEWIAEGSPASNDPKYITTITKRDGSSIEISFFSLRKFKSMYMKNGYEGEIFKYVF